MEEGETGFEIGVLQIRIERLQGICFCQCFVDDGARRQRCKEKLTDDAMLPFLGSDHLFGGERTFVERATVRAAAGAFEVGMQGLRHGFLGYVSKKETRNVKYWILIKFDAAIENFSHTHT